MTALRAVPALTMTRGRSGEEERWRAELRERLQNVATGRELEQRITRLIVANGLSWTKATLLMPRALAAKIMLSLPCQKEKGKAEWTSQQKDSFARNATVLQQVRNIDISTWELTERIRTTASWILEAMPYFSRPRNFILTRQPCGIWNREGKGN